MTPTAALGVRYTLDGVVARLGCEQVNRAWVGDSEGPLGWSLLAQVGREPVTRGIGEVGRPELVRKQLAVLPTLTADDLNQTPDRVKATPAVRRSRWSLRAC